MWLLEAANWALFLNLNRGSCPGAGSQPHHVPQPGVHLPGAETVRVRAVREERGRQQLPGTTRPEKAPCALRRGGRGSFRGLTWVWLAATSRTDPRQQQGWVLKCLQVPSSPVWGKLEILTRQLQLLGSFLW